MSIRDTHSGSPDHGLAYNLSWSDTFPAGCAEVKSAFVL